MTRSIAFLLSVAMTAAALVGCGGADDSGNTSAASEERPGVSAGTTSGNDSAGSNQAAEDTSAEASSLTKAEFINRANEICGRRSENFLTPIMGYISREASSGKDEAELAAEAVHKYFLPEYQKQVDELEELGAPAGDEKQVEAFLIAMQQGIDSLEARDRLSLLTDVDAAFKHAGELARAYGLENCL